MNYIKTIESIRTIRDFKKEDVPQGLIHELISSSKENILTGSINDIVITFINNGKKFYKDFAGKVGYFGKLIEAPHYILLSSKVFEGYIENSSYIMENLRLKAWNAGLGTCWLSIENEQELRESLGIDQEFTAIGLLAIGYQYKGIFKEDTSPKSTRLGVEELIFQNQWGKALTGDVLEERGLLNIFYYARFAPSWGNKQPWRFILDEDRVILTVEDKSISKKLDTGIAMLYFEKAAHEEGIGGKWVLGDIDPAKYNIPKEFKAVAYFKI